MNGPPDPADRLPTDPWSGVVASVGSAATRAPLRLDLTLTLPREAISVRLVRHLCGLALREVGATAECVAAVELAVTEACTNVLEHSGPGDAYQVSVELADRQCAVSVMDEGQGFDVDALAEHRPDDDAERGRGLNLMRALVDRAQFSSEPTLGATVRLVKRLDFQPDGPAQRLMTG